MSSGLSDFLSGINCRGVVVLSVAVLISSGLIVVGINCPVLTVVVLSVAVLNVMEPSIQRYVRVTVEAPN